MIRPWGKEQWFGNRGESERVVLRIIDSILEDHLRSHAFVDKETVLQAFRANSEVRRVFAARNISLTSLDGEETSRNMVDWFDSRYDRWQEHEPIFSKYDRADAGGFRYSRRRR